MCFVFIWEQTATCATYSINWLVFITEMKCVYCAVRTGSLNKAVCASSLKGYVHRNFTLCTVNNGTYDIPGYAHRWGGSMDSTQSQAGATRRSKFSNKFRLFYTREALITHLTRGWMDLWAGMDRTENFAPPGYDPRTVQAVANHYTDFTIPAVQFSK